MLVLPSVVAWLGIRTSIGDKLGHLTPRWQMSQVHLGEDIVHKVPHCSIRHVVSSLPTCQLASILRAGAWEMPSYSRPRWEAYTQHAVQRDCESTITV